ncbi:MAG TPA: PEP/pyruvate-binding domain-containing protein, partial [Promineifilum sp.]|nr:PEP/pyruvate-binding domain-containing protein [Promineifilum sp.]
MPTTTLPLPRSKTPAIDIYIRLAHYPVLADKIRARMRHELFSRGIIDEIVFEAQVREKAIESQRRERLTDPYGQEDTHIWQKRKARVRDFQTDALFADNLGSVLLDQIIQEVLLNQPSPSVSSGLNFNPEISPWEVLFRQGEIYEQLPKDEFERSQHHLEEIKVVLIKRLISDQLPYIGVAKRVFTINDLRYIYNRRIGNGKIGGKAAGLMLAWRILQQQHGDGNDIHPYIGIPESYFIGTEVIYEFRLMNGLDHYMNQKYREIEEIREEYPRIVEAHLAGDFSPGVIKQLRAVLADIGDSPLIVRSSSLLEDNFGYAFAGKYNSYFCPNQGTEEENLIDLLNAVRRVFASTLNPDAILYRQKHGLIDYDERMAILIQKAVGKPYRDFYFPVLAGVAFSQNPFRWNNQIRREDGFLRLVWGFGTRAVDRVSNDYPRLIALSHPQLRPETTTKAIRQYSQWYIDVIDVKKNSFETVHVLDILDGRYPYLRYIASVSRDDYLQEILSTAALQRDDELILTFNGVTKDRRFVNLMRTALQRLESAYGRPVDVEFVVDILPGYPQTEYRLHVLQCRPLSQRAEDRAVTIPRNIPPEKVLFTSNRLVPDGRAEGVRYIVFIDPQSYYDLHDTTTKHELARAIGRLNKRLENESFILMGPG